MLSIESISDSPKKAMLHTEPGLNNGQPQASDHCNKNTNEVKEEQSNSSTTAASIPDVSSLRTGADVATVNSSAVVDLTVRSTNIDSVDSGGPRSHPANGNDNNHYNWSNKDPHTQEYYGPNPDGSGKSNFYRSDQRVKATFYDSSRYKINGRFPNTSYSYTRNIFSNPHSIEYRWQHRMREYQNSDYASKLYDYKIRNRINFIKDKKSLEKNCEIKKSSNSNNNDKNNKSRSKTTNDNNSSTPVKRYNNKVPERKPSGTYHNSSRNSNHTSPKTCKYNNIKEESKNPSPPTHSHSKFSSRHTVNSAYHKRHSSGKLSPKATEKSNTLPALKEPSSSTISSGRTLAEQPTTSRNTAASNNVKVDKTRPKISLIPLARLIRNELLDLNEKNTYATQSNLEQAQYSSGGKPSKICTSNLVERHRNISTCSNSSSAAENLVDKVVNMDKRGIKNVINSPGTIYDEALKAQARRRLREEIRKQLKTINLEQPRDNATNVDFVTDEIVDAIHIPQIVLSEISQAFGIELLDSCEGTKNTERNRKKLNASAKCVPDVVQNIGDNPLSPAYVKSNGVRSLSSVIQPAPIASRRSSTDLRNRINAAVQLRALRERSPAKEQHTRIARFADETNNNSSKKPKIQEHQRAQKRPQQSDINAQYTRQNNKVIKSNGKLTPAKVIVINSSCSSASSSSSSSASSSSDEDSDSDSNTSKKSNSSSVRRRRQSQKINSENVIKNFETLILPMLSLTQNLRYKEKFSFNISIKLLYISCICTSEYNSSKFSKIDIAKLQRNLKAEDNSPALAFLMREIVNVFNKQKLLYRLNKEKDAVQKTLQEGNRNKEANKKEEQQRQQQQYQQKNQQHHQQHQQQQQNQQQHQQYQHYQHQTVSNSNITTIKQQTQQQHQQHRHNQHLQQQQQQQNQQQQQHRQQQQHQATASKTSELMKSHNKQQSTESNKIVNKSNTIPAVAAAMAEATTTTSSEVVTKTVAIKRKPAKTAEKLNAARKLRIKLKKLPTDRRRNENTTTTTTEAKYQSVNELASMKQGVTAAVSPAEKVADNTEISREVIANPKRTTDEVIATDKQNLIKEVNSIEKRDLSKTYEVEKEPADSVRETVIDKKREMVTENERKVGADKEREAVENKERKAVEGDEREKMVDNKRATVSDIERKTLVNAELESASDNEREAVAGTVREAATDNEREAVENTELEAVADIQRETVADIEQEAVADKNPEAVADNEREAAADNEREASADNEREAAADNEREDVVDNKRETEADIEREAIVDNKQETVEDTEREAVADTVLATMVDKNERESVVNTVLETVVDNKVEMMSGNKRMAVVDNKVEMMSGNKRMAVVDNKVEMMSGNKRMAVVDNEQEAVADAELEAASDNERYVAEDNEREAVADSNPDKSINPRNQQNQRRSPIEKDYIDKSPTEDSTPIKAFTPNPSCADPPQFTDNRSDSNGLSNISWCRNQENVSTTSSTVCGLDNVGGLVSIANLSAAFSNITQYPHALLPIDQNSLRPDRPVCEAVVANLREIDAKLLELHKRKMSIEEMILKLQKDKMEADLQTMRLQNEKFMLLNTAMAANATVTTVPSTDSASPSTTISSTNVVEKPSSSTPAIVETEVSMDRVTNIATQDACKKRKRQSSKATISNYKKRCQQAGPTITEFNGAKNTRSDKTTRESPDEISRRNPKEAKWKPSSTRTTRSSTMSATPSTVRSPSNDDATTCSPTSAYCASQDVSQSTLCPANNELLGFDEDYSDIPLGHFSDIKSPITKICVSEDSIIASSEDGNLYKFNINTLRLEKKFAKHREAITEIYLCRQKNMLYTTSLDGYMKRSSIENFDLDIHTIYLEEPLQSIDVEWGMAFIGSRWGNIFTYDIMNRLSGSILCSSNGSITALKATKEGPRKILIVTSKGNQIYFHDATSGLLLRSLNVPDNVYICSLLLDLSCLYCGTQKNEIYKYDFTTGTRQAVMKCGNGAVSMKLYKSKFLFVGCYDGFVYVLDIKTGHEIGRFPGSGKMLLALEIAYDKIITSAKDKSMRIMDIPKYIVARTKTEAVYIHVKKSSKEDPSDHKLSKKS